MVPTLYAIDIGFYIISANKFRVANVCSSTYLFSVNVNFMTFALNKPKFIITKCVEGLVE